MKRIAPVFVATLLFTAALAVAADKDSDGWISLFDGKTLNGWKKANENPGTCAVEDGTIRMGGGSRCHLFYVGPVHDHNFKDFVFKCKVMCKPHSNSGVYFHTEYQAEGWPDKGYEAQVNNTHADPRKTGGLYAVEDVMNNSPAKDNQWWDYEITVKGKTITLKVNGKTTVNYTEPENPEHLKKMPGRKLSSGTFALQGHDPGSMVYFKDIYVKPLD
jgi:3-keto-disaccharide hydrolase